MGFLDKKKRIIDTYLTPYGRKKLANGNMNISFVAATDNSAMYLKDADSKTRSGDFTEICNESLGSYQDQPFFDSSNIMNLLEGNIENEIVYRTGNYNIDGSGIVYETNSATIDSSENFLSTTDEIINDALQRIKNKKYLKNKANNEFDTFEIDKSEINFYVTDNSPIQSSGVKEIDITSTEPFFFDKYVSSFDNFKFLPPVVPSGQSQNEKVMLGNYTDLNQEDINNYSDVEEIVKNYPVKEINFVKNSRDSNLVFQIFGVKDSNNESKITKLDTVDFGEFYQDGSFKKVIFAGKVFIDNTYNYPTYANIFTIVMED
jgi:hypothetical protein